MRYTLDDINKIIFEGFDYNLPENTLEIISQLALQVGSPDYVRTPVFKKRENPLTEGTSSSGAGASISSSSSGPRKGKRGKQMEVVNDEDWEAVRTPFQATKIEHATGIDLQIDTIRALLNKLTDKNYTDITNKIIIAFDSIVTDEITNEDILRVSSAIFDIASTNRFYSKIYADMYADLSRKHSIINRVLHQNLQKFEYLFNVIEYVEPTENYNKFCEINKANEKRKSLASFYLNLAYNSVIEKSEIIRITKNLLGQMYTFMNEDNKKNEVDELTETIAILYKKDLYISKTETETPVDVNDYDTIDGHIITDIIEKIAKCKVKDYKSLTNKSLFKFMDLVEM